MLRRLALTILLVSAVAVFLTPSAGATDNPKFLMATGTENFLGLQPGDVTCAGGQPTGLHYPDRECSPGTHRTLVRGEVQLIQLSGAIGTAAAMFEGATHRLVLNCNLDADLKGECWGTFKITVTGQGEWEGAWQGRFDVANLTGFYSAVGHGSGLLDGLQMKYYAIYNGFTAPVVFNVRVNSK
jgi:hypothetical protein